MHIPPLLIMVFYLILHGSFPHFLLRGFLPDPPKKIQLSPPHTILYFFGQLSHSFNNTSHNLKLWAARRSNQSILKAISLEYSLEGLMLKLKLQCFGHLIRRTDSLEKTLMLGKFEGRRRGQ